MKLNIADVTKVLIAIMNLYSCKSRDHRALKDLEFQVKSPGSHEGLECIESLEGLKIEAESSLRPTTAYFYHWVASFRFFFSTIFVVAK